MQSLYDLADDKKLRKITLLGDPVTERDVIVLEDRLRESPSDLVTRAKLLAYFSERCANALIANPMFAERRIEHITWFLENIPDSRFCGERFFYVSAADPYYVTLKRLWASEIAKSTALMRRVNSYFLLLANSDDDCSTVFEEWFAAYLDEVWVRALKDISRSSHVWCENLAAEELGLARAVSYKQTNNLNAGELKALAATAANLGTVAQFRNAISAVGANQADLESRVFLLGYTFGNYSLDNLLGFDPTLAAIRFKHMCWCISQMPASEFLQSAFAMDPFVGIDSFNETLTALWLEQIRTFPEQSQVIVNAATYCHKLENESLLNRLAAELKQSPDSKVLFQKVGRQFNRRS